MGACSVCAARLIQSRGYRGCGLRSAPHHLGKNDLARFVRSYSAHIHRRKVGRVANLQRSPMRQASGDASEVESRVWCAINFMASATCGDLAKVLGREMPDHFGLVPRVSCADSAGVRVHVAGSGLATDRRRLIGPGMAS
jgi:hypothetical protein